MDKIYFANEESKRLVQVLEHKLQQEKELRARCGIDKLQYRNRVAYNAALSRGSFESGLDFSGSNDELIETTSNQLRSLCRQFLALITRQRLDFEVHSDTTESTNLTGTRLASSLVKHVINKQKMDKRGDELAQLCLIDGDSYLYTIWDPSKGRAIQEGINAGDLVVKVVPSADVCFEGEDVDQSDWCIVRSKVNKFDLIANYPDLEKEILKAEQVADSDELVYQYAFYHLKSPAMPEGRICLFTSHDCVFYDAPNPYPWLNLSQMKPEPIDGTKFGYTFMNDMVGLQTLHDNSLSAAASNVAAFGLGTLLNPEGNGLSRTDIGGIQFLNYKTTAQGGGGKPEPLALPSSSPEIYRFSDVTKAAMQEISGISSVLRGNPPPNVTSGAFASILSANAIENSQPFAKAYFLALEDCMFKAIQCYKLFAKYPQLISVVGLNKSSQVKEFVGGDLGEVAKITMRVTSPLLQTSAGLSDVSEKLLKSGLISNASQYLELISTGNIESFTGDSLDALSFINKENELLSEGKPAKALVSDPHGQHIQRHKGILNDPDLRARAQAGDPEAVAVVKATIEHIGEHYELMKNSDPMFLSLLETGKLPQSA